MELIKCKECEREVSTSAKKCPHCGVNNPSASGGNVFGGFVILAVIVGAMWWYMSDGDKPKPTASNSALKPTLVKSTPPPACDSTTVITGKSYSVIGSEYARKGPGTSFDKVINQKATDIIHSTIYITISDSDIYYEECTKDGWSWVRIIEHAALQGLYKGWIPSSTLSHSKYFPITL